MGWRGLGSVVESRRFSSPILLPLLLSAFPISRKPLVGPPGLSPQATAFPSEKRPDFPDIKTAAGIKRNPLDKSRFSGLRYPHEVQDGFRLENL